MEWWGKNQPMREILKLCGRREWVNRKKTSEGLWGNKYLSCIEGDVA